MRRFLLMSSALVVFLAAPSYAVPISTYPPAGTLTGTEIIPLVRSGYPGGFQSSPAAFATYDQTHLPGTSGQFLFNSGGSMTTIAPGSAATLFGLAPVATSGLYSDLGGKPTLGTAAAANTGTSGAVLGFLNANLTHSGSVTFTSATAINRNAVALPAARTGTVLQVGNTDATATRIETDAFGAPGFFTAVREDGTAVSPTTLQAGDEMGGLNAYGYNGTAIVGPQASFRSYAAQNWSTGATGTYSDIAITPMNTTTLTSVMRFESDTGITIPPTVTGGDKGAGTINVAGPIYASGTDVSKPTEALCFALSDETTALVTGTTVITNRVPYPFTLTGIRGSLTTASTGADVVLDAKASGTSILSGAKLDINAGSTTSVGSSIPAVLVTTALTDDQRITFDITQVGSSVAGAGAKVCLIGHRT